MINAPADPALYAAAASLPRPSPLAYLPRNTSGENRFYQDNRSENMAKIQNGLYVLINKFCVGNPEKPAYIFHYTNYTDNILLHSDNVSDAMINIYKKTEQPILYAPCGLEHERIAFFDNFTAICTSYMLTHRISFLTFFSVYEVPEDLDLSILKNKKVLYYFIPVWNKTLKENCERTKAIIEKMPSSTQVYIWSEIPIHPGQVAKKMPYLYSKDDFVAAASALKSDHGPYEPMLWGPPETERRKIFQNPVIYERSVCLLYGSHALLRTDFLVDLALSAALDHNFPFLRNSTPFDVIYIHIDPDAWGFTERLHTSYQSLSEDHVSRPEISNPPPLDNNACMIFWQPKLTIFPCDSPICQQTTRHHIHYFTFRPNQSGVRTSEKMLFSLLNKLPHNLPLKAKLVILDIPELCLYVDDYANLNDFLYMLRSHYTVILSCNQPNAQEMPILANLNIDIMMHFKSSRNSGKERYLELMIDRDYFNSKTKIQKINFFKIENKSLWHVIRERKTSVAEKIAYIKKHKTLPIKEIAWNLGISIPYVKKLRKAAGVVRKVTQRRTIII